MEIPVEYISAVSSNYEDILKYFGQEKVLNRYVTLICQYSDFIKEKRLETGIRLNRLILAYALMDYFSDVRRIKDFHKNIELINKIKIISYQTYWLLKRKPLQILADDKTFIFANEEFAFYSLAQYMCSISLYGNTLLTNERYLPFWTTLSYYLKFRMVNPQSLELMLTAFNMNSPHDKCEP